MNASKYKPFSGLNFPQRTWPDKQLTAPPRWCSIDLRDGNQSLETPMSIEQKLEFFKYLTGIGFKEIEIGFPSSSEIEFNFARLLIEQNLIPDDVTIQVLTQSRIETIPRTFEALKGVKKAVVHLYAATAPLFRDVVFNRSREDVIEMVLFGAKMLNELADKYGRDRFIFEFSPECFSQTEPDYAIEVCNTVIDCWQGREVIINLPFTVEGTTPNIHADMIEYTCGKLKNRENITVSLHSHNDRGTAVAATELCLLAGADRVEGTLFANGERTGNVDIITLAMNLYSQGIDPGLDFSNIDTAINMYERTTKMPVHPRHPYAGRLVYTAFSGGHQDAIRKGMTAQMQKPANATWEVPYLPIDPQDVGRTYDQIIRFNSESGSASVAYILETNYHINIPKGLQRDFGPITIHESAVQNKELSPAEIYELFKATYINLDIPAELLTWHETRDGEVVSLEGAIKWYGKETPICGTGEGVFEAFCQGLTTACGVDFKIIHYS